MADSDKGLGSIRGWLDGMHQFNPIKLVDKENELKTYLYRFAKSRKNETVFPSQTIPLICLIRYRPNPRQAAKPCDFLPPLKTKWIYYQSHLWMRANCITSILPGLIGTILLCNSYQKWFRRQQNLSPVTTHNILFLDNLRL